jgi:hypothetical protein
MKPFQVIRHYNSTMKTQNINGIRCFRLQMNNMLLTENSTGEVIIDG